MLNHLTLLYAFNLKYAEKLVKDVSPEQMVHQPGGVINHPSWSLGHLVVSANRLGQLLGLKSQLPDGWEKIFATGGIPSGNEADYPSKEEILEALREQHARNAEAVAQSDPSAFTVPHPNEKTRSYFPTVGDMVIFMMTSHEMDHLGQIAAWRRAMGLGSATGV